MKTENQVKILRTCKYKDHLIEITHDVVWGFAFLVMDPNSKMWHSEERFTLSERTSWATEKETLDAAIETIEQSL